MPASEPPPISTSCVCRTQGCGQPRVALSLCFACLRRYRDAGDRADGRLDTLARELAPHVEERLPGFAPGFRAAMARNLAAQLVALEHPVVGAQDAWCRAFSETVADGLA